MQQPIKSPGAMLQHISNNITKLLEVLEDVKTEPSDNESWATIPTLPRLISKKDVKKTISIEPYLKILSILLASITSIVAMLSAALTKVIEFRKRARDIKASEELGQTPTKKVKKKRREKKDVLADDGTHIVIVPSKQLPDILSDKYFVVNINTTHKKFSTRHAHMHIPIPFMKENRVGSTVEGIWQGLQVYENEDTNGEYMIATNPRYLVRKVKGKLKGWRKGLRGEGILPLIEARKQILMVMYKYVLENNLQKEIRQIRQKMEKEDKIIIIVGEGNEIGWNVEDESVPFGAAGMLKLYLIEKNVV